MANNTKLKLIDGKFEQISVDTLSLSGTTIIYGNIEYGGDYSSGFTSNSLVNKEYLLYQITGQTGTTSISFAVSDETTDLTVNTTKTTLRIPYNFKLNNVIASVSTAPSGSTLIVDINKNGGSVLSTEITIDSGEKTSVTAATQPVISDNDLTFDSEITVDIDQIGAITAGTGLKIYLIQ